MCVCVCIDLPLVARKQFSCFASDCFALFLNCYTLEKEANGCVGYLSIYFVIFLIIYIAKICFLGVTTVQNLFDLKPS